VKCQLLASGILAGPLFVAVGLIQAFTRVGFDLRRHALSLLSLGGWGGSRSPTSWWPAPASRIPTARLGWGS
jgi:hypothetical protein